MVFSRSLPERPAIVPGFVSGDCLRAALFPRMTVLADRDHRLGLTGDDCGMATAGHIDAVCRHCVDYFAFGDLALHIWEGGDVTVSAGPQHHRRDVGSDGVRGKVLLAPMASALRACHSPPPKNLKQLMSTRRFRGSSARRYEIWTASVLFRRQRVVWTCTDQSWFADFSRLETMPLVCRSVNLTTTWMVRQNRIAASRNTAARPRLPSCCATRIMSLSHQISRDPSLRSTAE
jgi:hypothetical protein